MSNNGKSLFLFVGSIIGSCVAIAWLIYGVVFAPLSRAIADETKCRADNVSELRKEQIDIKKDVEVKLEKLQDTAQKNTIMLARICERMGISGPPN